MTVDIVKIIDEMFIYLMRFTRENIIEESISNSVTPAQFGVLYLLSCHGCMTMKDLSRHLKQTHGASTGLIDRLLKSDLVQRERSESDRRVVHVSITEKGQQMIHKITHNRHSILQDVIREMNEEEQNVMLTALTLITEKLKHHEKA
jgi:DNA-binding MarR family transcriptional regulator